MRFAKRPEVTGKSCSGIYGMTQQFTRSWDGSAGSGLEHTSGVASPSSRIRDLSLTVESQDRPGKPVKLDCPIQPRELPMKGKVVLVTGANRGLGTYVTQAF